jgi:ankyrin repeat protein
VQCGGGGDEVLTDDALVGCAAGRRAQNGWTPLGIACYRGHVVAVELLLAHADVKVNQATKVRRRGGVGGERGQEWQGYPPWCCGGGRLISQLRRLMRDTACTCSHMWGSHADGAGRCAWRWREDTGLQRGRL